jgi:hypothetical protein
MTRKTYTLEKFKKLSPRQQEAVLFISRQLKGNYDALFVTEKHQQGIGETGSIELAMKLIQLVGSEKLDNRK